MNHIFCFRFEGTSSNSCGRKESQIKFYRLGEIEKIVFHCEQPFLNTFDTVIFLNRYRENIKRIL